MRLKQIILLILRTLAVIAIVLAFARPALHSDEAAGSAAAVEMVIILDDGITSGAETRDGQVLRLAIQRADEIANLVGTNDRVTLISTSKPDRKVSNQKTIVRNSIGNTQFQLATPQLEACFSTADSIFQSTGLFNRELYILSGFYGSAWDSIEYGESDQFLRKFLIPVGPQHLDNLCIDKISIRNTIFRRGSPVEIEAVMKNYGSRPAQNTLVSVYLGEERVASASVDIPAEGTVKRTFAVVPATTGQLSGWIKFEDTDPLAADSKRFFILDVPDSNRVLAVMPDSTDRIILKAALSGDATDFIRLDWGDPIGWETSSLGGYDVLILGGVEKVSSGGAQRVVEFVKAGGGIIIFQGMEADLANLSRSLWRPLGFAGAQGTSSGKFGWGKIDLEHPVFWGIFEGKGKPVTPTFNSIVDVGIGRGDKVIIPLSNGKPLLMERSVGRGRAMFFATPLGTESGDFIYAGIFAPLVFRSVAYAAASSGNGETEWVTGSNYRFVLSLPRALTSRMVAPDESMIELPPRPVSSGVEYHSGTIDIQGIYDIFVDDHIVRRYASNVPTTESNLTRIDLKDLSQRFNGASIIKGEAGDLAEKIYSTRFGRELWKPIALAFVLLLLVESVLGRSSRREDEET